MRPSVGKSLFSNEILFSTMREANREGKKVICLYVSMEMKSKSQVLRLCLKEVGVGMEELLSINSPLSPEMIKLIMKKTKEYTKYPIFFKEMSETSDEFIEMIEKVHKQFPDHQIICLIDHSRLFTSGIGEKNEITKLVRLTQGLVRVQQKTNCINILLSQLNREADSPSNKANNYVPQLSHLFGSDSLAQEAHMVLLLNRPFDLFGVRGDYCGTDAKNLLACHISKSRASRTGMLAFNIDLNTLSIEERDTSNNN